MWTGLVFLALLSGSAAAQAPCQIQFSTGVETFDHCFQPQNVGDDFYIHWSLLPGTAGSNMIRWGMNSTSNGHTYVALAYPGEDDPDNSMIGGTAFSLQACDSCLTGAQIREIYMTAAVSGGMHDSNSYPLTDVKAEQGGSVLAGAFTTQMPPQSTDGEIIYAVGEVYRTGDIRMHSEYGDSTLNFQTGEIQDAEWFSKSVSPVLAAHIWLLIIGWGFMIPVGIVIARCFKSADPFWFQAHRALQSLGLLLGIIGFALGWVVAGGWDGVFTTHRNLGIAATVFGVLQATALFVRPQLRSHLRRKWNVMHWWMGRAAVCVAVGNIYYGLARMVDTGNWGWGAYTAVLGSIVAVAIIKESWDYIQKPPPGLASKANLVGTEGSRLELANNGGKVLPPPPSPAVV